MSSTEKPYKILIRSPRGCIFDKLMCIKCCDTVLRGNYTRHKRTEKHINLHKHDGGQTPEDTEINKHKQIARVIKYHKQLKETIPDTDDEITSTEPDTDDDERKEYIERIRMYGVKPIETKKVKNTPLYDKFDKDVQRLILELYTRAKNMYTRINPLDHESNKRIRRDLNIFEMLLDGEIYEKTPELVEMIEYYNNLN
jgi:hypothetical protein